jgi:ATP-dependent protease ClpP protease subunit
MSYYTITARGPVNAEVRIDGPIGDSWFEESVTAKAFTAELDRIQASQMTVYLNSPGGSVMDANVIYAALKRHRATVKVVIDGWALSAASLIAMAGDTVEIGQRSLMMLHNPRTFAEGDAPALRKASDVLDKIKAGMVETYNARLKLAPDSVAALLDAETWYSASEAVTAGLADTLIPDSAAPAPVPAKIRNQFSFIPAAYAAYLTEAVMAHDTFNEASVVPVAAPAIPESTLASDAASVVSESVATVADLDIDARIAARISAERERVKAVRAAFAPWLKRGYDLTALQATCEDEGLEIAAVNARLLSALGSMAEPLAAGQGAATAGQAEPDVAQLSAKLFNQVSGKGK